MRVTRNFTFEELTTTQTGLPNVPDTQAVINLVLLAVHVLQPARERFGEPVFVNSGYRSQAVNSAVGGAPQSQHLLGQAADITASHADTDFRAENKRLFELIRSSELPFDQLIDERNYSWIHVSYAPQPRMQVLHLQ